MVAGTTLTDLHSVPDSESEAYLSNNFMSFFIIFRI